MVRKRGYTSVSQSEELSKFLSNETADMVYIKYASSDNLTCRFDDGLVMVLGDIPIDEIDGGVLPCWSLYALLNLLPSYEINKRGVNKEIQIDVANNALETEDGETLVDLVVNMILELHKDGYFKR